MAHARGYSWKSPSYFVVISKTPFSSVLQNVPLIEISFLRNLKHMREMLQIYTYNIHPPRPLD